MMSARTMKNVRENGSLEVNWRRMKAMYASKGHGKTGSKEPMMAMRHKTLQNMINAISIPKKLKIKK
jgi:hypothetical protein